jgi:hypothetical protein
MRGGLLERLNTALAQLASVVILVPLPVLGLFFFIGFLNGPKTGASIGAAFVAAWFLVGWLAYVNLLLFRSILEKEAPSFYEREVRAKSFVPILMGSQFGAIAVHRLVVDISKAPAEQLSRRLRLWAFFARALNIFWFACGLALAAAGLWRSLSRVVM